MRHNRPGYALIYLLAAIPLLIVIGNMAVTLTGRALRAQRVAAHQAELESARTLILNQLRRDTAGAFAAVADSAAFGPGLQLNAGGTTVASTAGDTVIAYTAGEESLVRVVTAGGVEQSRTTWSLPDTAVGFRWESASPDAGVVWVRFQGTLSMDPRLPTRREMATAIRVQTGGAR